MMMIDPCNMEVDQVTVEECREIIECYGFPDFIIKHLLESISETVDESGIPFYFIFTRFFLATLTSYFHYAQN